MKGLKRIYGGGCREARTSLRRSEIKTAESWPLAKRKRKNLLKKIDFMMPGPEEGCNLQRNKKLKREIKTKEYGGDIERELLTEEKDGGGRDKKKPIRD